MKHFLVFCVFFVSFLKRVMKDFSPGKDVCFSTWIYNSISNISYLLIPNIYYSPTGIITRTEIKNQIKKDRVLGKL